MSSPTLQCAAWMIVEYVRQVEFDPLRTPTWGDLRPRSYRDSTISAARDYLVSFGIFEENRRGILTLKGDVKLRQAASPVTHVAGFDARVEKVRETLDPGWGRKPKPKPRDDFAQRMRERRSRSEKV